MYKRLFCLFILPLLLVGCSAKGEALAERCSCETREDRILAVVTALYTLPDEYHIENKNVWKATDSFTLCDKDWEAWQAYDRSRFHAWDFAPSVLEELTTLDDSFADKSINALGILGPRYDRYSINSSFPVGLEKMLHWADDSTLACTAVESEQQEDGSWQFGALIILSEYDAAQTPFNIWGTAQFNEDGKFTAVQITDDGGLSEYLEDEIIWSDPDKIIVDYGNGPSPGPPVTPAP